MMIEGVKRHEIDQYYMELVISSPRTFSGINIDIVNNSTLCANV